MNVQYNRPQESENEDQEEVRAGREKISRQQKRPIYGRTGRAPSAFNGIHRRRNKRVSW